MRRKASCVCISPIILPLSRLAMAEAQRRASQSNLSLSEESLQEYRRLFVSVSFFRSDLMGSGFIERRRPASSPSRNVKFSRSLRGKKRLHHGRLHNSGIGRRNSSKRGQVCARRAMYTKQKEPMYACLYVSVKDACLRLVLLAGR